MGCLYMRVRRGTIGRLIKEVPNHANTELVQKKSFTEILKCEQWQESKCKHVVTSRNVSMLSGSCVQVICVEPPSSVINKP